MKMMDFNHTLKTLEYPPITRDNFVNVGTMQVTDIGLKRCQSLECMDDSLKILMADIAKKPKKSGEMIIFCIGIALCTDENARVRMNDADLSAFVKANIVYISRIALTLMSMMNPAYLAFNETLHSMTPEERETYGQQLAAEVANQRSTNV